MADDRRPTTDVSFGLERNRTKNMHFLLARTWSMPILDNNNPIDLDDGRSKLLGRLHI